MQLQARPRPGRGAAPRSRRSAVHRAAQHVGTSAAATQQGSPAVLQGSSGASTSGVEAPAAGVTLYYRTTWSGGRVHGSANGGAWQDYPFSKVASAPGKWLKATISAAAPAAANGTGAAAPVLEFVVTDGRGEWDKAPDGGNYTLDSCGTFTLRGGRVTPVEGRPVCLVSDLDGTMVGDDAATGAFKTWWEDTGVVRGGLLVYNTGRSLESFQQLLAEKGHCLARPDVLISAVGTKIYNYAGSGRWREDPGWVDSLGEGWDLQVVRDAAYAALAEVGREAMHFRPPEEQNDHKVTCGVRTDALDTVLGRLEGAFKKGGVDVNVITSGTGDWRFLDLVPKRAGKLQALDYVRTAHGFPLSATVACGDSGNDILMLSGPNLAVVVGNAQPDLAKWVEQRGDEAGPVLGKRRLVRAAAHEARGILEGLQYFGLA